MSTDVSASPTRITARGSVFFVPALALAIAAVVTGIASLGNTFEGALASLIAFLPTIAALTLGHLTLSEEQAPLMRRITLGGLAVAYIALALVVVSTVT